MASSLGPRTVPGCAGLAYPARRQRQATVKSARAGHRCAALGMLYGKVLRSPHAHARILHWTPGAAVEALPGKVASTLRICRYVRPGRGDGRGSRHHLLHMSDTLLAPQEGPRGGRAVVAVLVVDADGGAAPSSNWAASQVCSVGRHAGGNAMAEEVDWPTGLAGIEVGVPAPGPPTLPSTSISESKDGHGLQPSGPHRGAGVGNRHCALRGTSSPTTARRFGTLTACRTLWTSTQGPSWSVGRCLLLQHPCALGWAGKSCPWRLGRLAGGKPIPYLDVCWGRCSRKSGKPASS